jgi:hypothetical protein
MGGILYVTIMTILGIACPLTIMENGLREHYNPDLTYHGSFVVHYIEKIVYPEANFLFFLIPTLVIAVFSIVMFIIRPPAKIKCLFRGR